MLSLHKRMFKYIKDYSVLFFFRVPESTTFKAQSFHSSLFTASTAKWCYPTGFAYGF